MFKILIADSLPASVLEAYNQLEDVQVDNRSGISAEELAEVLGTYDGLVVRSRTKVTANLLEKPGKLKIIGRAGAGVDNIDTKAATHRGIIVMNTPGGNTIAATEHTLALLLSALRSIPPAHASIQSGKWDRKSFMGRELFEKTVGVVGLGKIGQGVATRVRSFGTKILGYDPLMTREMADRLGVKLVSLNELLEQSDIITLHVPKIPETLNLINAESLKRCKDGVVIVNCARGGIVNEQDLIAALDSGKVSTAAVDVFVSEPPENYDLAKHPKVVATPHLGASTEEAQTKVAAQILDQMIEYFRKNVALHAVNFISVDEKIQPIVAPYFELATRLGELFSRIKPGRLKEVAMRFYGDIITLPDMPIASHLMAGAMVAGDEETHDVELINMVNSLTIARDKGIQVEITKKDQPLTSHTNFIACDFQTEKGMVHLGGTVFANGIFRLVEFNQYLLEAELGGKMVIVENNDVPGIIGRVGTLLAEQNINIGQVSSGRDRNTNTALNIFNVEGDLPASLRNELQADDNIKNVMLVEL